MNAVHLNAVFEWVVDETDLHSCTCKSYGAISVNKLTRLCSLCFITVLQTFCEGPNNGGPSLAKFHEGPNPGRIDAYESDETWPVCCQIHIGLHIFV